VGWPMLVQLLVNHSYIITVTHVTVKIEPTLELSGEIYEALHVQARHGCLHRENCIAPEYASTYSLTRDVNAQEPTRRADSQAGARRLGLATGV